MERKIGEIFEYDGEWYQCVEDKSCNRCAFKDTKCGAISNIKGFCSEINRSDKKSVIFKKLEKVGKPYYSKYFGEFYQKYITYIPAVGYNFKVRIEPVEHVSRTEIYVELKQKEDMEEKKLNLNPFDIQKAKEGKPVYTRDGRKVRIICFDAKMKRNIIALIQDYKFKDEEIAVEYFPNGCFYDNDFDTSLDLMMPPEKKEGWINVYKMKESTFGYITAYFDTEEKAKEDKEQLTGYVATIKINWEE